MEGVCVIWAIVYLGIGILLAIFFIRMEGTTFSDLKESPIELPIIMLVVVVLWPVVALFAYLQSKE